MIEHEFRAMGSKILAILDCEQSDAAASELDQVPVWFEEWEQALSRFRIDSELSQLNARLGAACRVSPTVWAVLEVSLKSENLTDGLVNPLVLGAVVEAGYDQPFDLLEAGGTTPRWNQGTAGLATATARYALPPVSQIIVDASTRTICIPEGMGLDFGGVAKGWAAHEAAQRLGTLGPALVSAGGDVAVSGPRPSGEPWRIGVEDPAHRERYLEMIYLERGGVATSGKDHRHWRRGGVFQHHIIDPRSLKPAETDVTAATVIASDAMRAEALAKAVLIAGSGAGLELVDEHADAEAILVLDDGTMRYSRDVGDYL